ncbi:hypothetical protein [Nocardia thailandica]|uniref:hypothetical protein n=1 Tax=Nocardia thailandica TaxID=257275 RepID=UPI0002E77C4B|nr:hypothetical protein [Nocardia thailandica]
MNSNVWPIGIWAAVTLAGLLGTRWMPAPAREIALAIIGAQAWAAVTIFAVVGLILVVTA